jgi:CheY-like chemotaxis protein
MNDKYLPSSNSSDPLVASVLTKSTRAKAKTFVDRFSIIPNVSRSGRNSSVGSFTEHLAPQQFIVIEIEDTGIGLSPEAMDQLFSPFKQAQSLAGGTGLGLYSLSKRMEALNGYYGVEGRRDGNQGCMFWFAFPYRPDLEMAKTKPSKRLSVLVGMPPTIVEEHDQGSKDHANNPTPKREVSPIPLGPISLHQQNSYKAAFHDDSNEPLLILLVDDSLTIQKMTGSMLQKHGHHVDIAENGAAALDKIFHQYHNTGKPYDLVLMDLSMPVMDGLEATRRLRQKEDELNQQLQLQHQQLQQLKKIDGLSLLHHLVVGISANTDSDVVISTLESGADEFMCKPFTMQTFVDTMEKLLEHSE